MSVRLIALDPKIFGEGIIQPAAVDLITIAFDQGGGAYMELTLASGHVVRSHRMDVADGATAARLKAYRDTLVDRINAALDDAREPAPGPAEPEKMRLS